MKTHLSLISLGCSAVLVGSIHAGNIDWDGDANGDFNNAGNWFGNSNPAGFGGWVFTNNLVLDFNNSSAATLNYNYGAWNNIGDISVAATFDDVFSGPVTWNGDGNGLNFNQRLENYSTLDLTFGTMKFSGAKSGATQIELNPVNGNLTFSSSSAIFNDNSRPYRVFGDNGKTLTLNTTLGVGPTAANVNLSVEQNSVVIIGAAQTYTGDTTIKAGRIELDANGSVAGAIKQGNTVGTLGAELRLTDADGGFTENATLTVNAGAAGYATRIISSANTSGINTLSGNVIMNAITSINTAVGGTLNLSGVLSGAGNFSTAGAGTLRLSGTSANTYTGIMTIASGTTLEIDKTNVAAIANQRVALVNGTVKWLQAGVANNSAQFTVNAGGLLDLNGNNASFAYSGNERLTLSGGTIQTGAGIWTMTGNNATNAGLVNGTTVSTITGNVDFGGADRSTTVFDNASGVDFNLAANLTDASSGATVRAMVYSAGSGSPEIVLGGNNAYRGQTTINIGLTIYADHANVLGTATSGGTFNSNGTLVTAGATLALRGGLTYAPETLRLNFSTVPGLRSISGNNVWAGTIGNPGGSNTLPAILQVEADSLTVTGSMVEFLNSSRNLAKTGPGALIYDNAANNIAGSIFVNSGVFAFKPAGEVNVRGGNSVLNGGVVAAPDNITLALGVGNNQVRFGPNGGGFAAYGANMAVDVSGVATLVWGGSTLTQLPVLRQVSGMATFPNPIYFGGTGYTGSETVTITGGGGTGATGTITVSGGTITGFTLTNPGSGYTSDPMVVVGAPTADGGTANFLANNAPLILNSAFSAHILTLNDNIDLASSGASFTGQREIHVLDNPASVDDFVIMAGVISSSKSGVGISKTGNGTLKLAAANTYSGSTNVSAGKLEISGSGSAVSSSAINVSGGTLLLDGAGDRIGNGAPVTLSGGKLEFSGSVTEDMGTLMISGPSTMDLGTGSVVATFDNSASLTWSGVLKVWNWTSGTDQLFFSLPTGLTSTQAGTVAFYSGDNDTGYLGQGSILPSGELAPVPEPTAVLAVGVLGCLIFRREMKRQRVR
jgi:autotransporter-associated beta strand protein